MKRSAPQTLIEISVVGGMFRAVCPHVPDERYSSYESPDSDSKAVTGLIIKVREWIALHPYETPWVEAPRRNAKADGRHMLSGLWPKHAKAPARRSRPQTFTGNMNEEHNHGE